MKKIEKLATFLIGFSYSFLIYNKIAFGISLSLGVLILLMSNYELVLNSSKTFSKRIKKNDLIIFSLFIISFLTSSLFSIKVNRSIEVVLYLILFIFFSISIYLLLVEKKKFLQYILNFLTISIFLNSLVILIYHFANYSGVELIRFKGVMNIISLLTIINFYLKKSKLNYLSLIFLFPNIYFSGSSSSVLGLIGGVVICSLFLTFLKFSKMKMIRILFPITIICFFITSLFLFSQKLPNKFDDNSIRTFKSEISNNLIDVHRQFIWGFSIEKFKEKKVFGFGPDTSNFIEGGQKEIGLESTGDMNFIPSHPHNFIIELLLETGILGTSLFFLILTIINVHILKINRSLQSQIFIIFFNSYFWCASLVNFSFWMGWWQASFYFILALITSKNHHLVSKTRRTRESMN
ncbi:MAG: O-antigen ligase family protein [Alphaproteobacteria bacterium]